MLMNALIAVGGLIAGLLAGLFIIGQKTFNEAEEKRKAENLLKQREEQIKHLLQQAADKARQIHDFNEREMSRLNFQNQKLEQILHNKEQLLFKKAQRNKAFQDAICGEEKLISELKRESAGIQQIMSERLLQKTASNKTALKEQLLDSITRQWRADGETHLRIIEENSKENASREAKNRLCEAIYKFSGESSVEKECGEIIVPKDSIKGRIVGRGGGNIMFFEELFGVDVVFNDAPNIISVSCFNLINQEIAKLALIRLMNERAIDENVIRRVKETAVKDMEKKLLKDGLEAVKIIGLGNVNPEFAKLIGRLNYRTSYGQNVLRHSIEIAYFSRILAAELGVDQKIAFTAGFLHDIGKAVDQETGGSHDRLTKEILEKYGFSAEIVHAAWTHHDAEPQKTPEAFIVKAADAISASRPGARSISLEQYLQKIKELEQTVLAFDGVKKAFAISAGREVRVIIDPIKKSDDESRMLADLIADKIEEKGGYPGKIKVTTIRITKAAELAKRKL